MKRPAWAKRVAQVFGLAALVPLLCAVGWIAWNVFFRAPAPTQLWTAADLPAVRADKDNGWAEFDRAAKARGHVPTDRRLVEVCAPSARSSADRWLEARGHEAEIRDQAGDSAHAAWVALLYETMGKPAFSDACPISFDNECQFMKLLQAHRAFEVSVLDSALSGRWNEAVVRSSRLLRGDVSFASTARSLLAQLISLNMLQRALVLAEVVWAGRAEAAARGEQPEIDGASLRGLDDAVVAVRMEDLDLKRGVIAEYLFAMEAMRVVEDPAGTPDLEIPQWGPLGRLLFDKGATMRVLNEEYAALAAFAASPSTTPAPVFTAHSDGRLWWVHNPVGELMLDGMRVDFAERLRKADLERQEIMKRRDALRAQIGPALVVP